MMRLLGGATLVLAAVASFTAAAQETKVWPTRAIRYVQPYHGLPDMIARAYNEKVAAILGQPVVPDYKLGAGGRIALAELAKAEPNGYTIGMATSGPLVLHPLLYAEIPYDPDESFAPLAVLGISPMALAVPAGSSVKSLDDLRKLSETRELNIAMGGIGGPGHLASVLLQKAGVRGELVNFRSSAQVMPAMVSGTVDAYFDTVYQQDVFVKQGQYRAIAVTSAERMPQLPDVPTFAELGLPHIDNHTFYVSVAPAGTPQPVLERLTAAYAAAAETPEIRELLRQMALLPMIRPRSELETFFRSSRARWKKVIDENDIRVE